MNRLYRFAVRLALGLVALTVAAPALAAVCSVNSGGVSFGTYDPLSASALDGTGNINVSCDVVTAFTVTLSSGSSVTYAERKMAAGANTLGYNLYVDSLRTSVWGDGITTAEVAATGTNVDLPVYGRMPGLQNVPAGAYADTIIVTVTY